VTIGIDLELDTREKLVIGHRGAPNEAPENTLKGYAAAWELGADMVELDVQQTKDGALVCIHDYDLCRTTTGEGTVAETDLVGIRPLDAGDGEKVPLLSEALDMAKGNFALDIELKSEGIEERVLDLVNEYDMLGSVVFSSFSEDSVLSLKEMSGQAAVGLIVKSAEHKVLDRILELGLDFVAPLFYQLSEESVSYAHDSDLLVYPWTVNDEEYMWQMLDCDVDGIITDVPGLCVQIIDEYLKNV
jgi:glycerophosphoryl diester phosphodiesterase